MPVPDPSSSGPLGSGGDGPLGQLRDALARAIYETDHGTNGYPPLHQSIPWDQAMSHRLEYERADRIIAKLVGGFDA